MSKKKNVKKGRKKTSSSTKDSRGQKKEKKEEIKSGKVQSIRGMRDILPDEQGFWDFLEKKANELSRAYGFKKIITPILEPTELFIKGTGEESDIVSKEMYSFIDQGGDRVTLRPEFTPSFARAYIEHGMISLPQPVKLYSFGPLFRRERPQAGRYRQFHQWNVEAIGDSHPVIDAQLVGLLYNYFSELDLEVRVRINSIGCSICRQEFNKTLIGYYRTKKSSLCNDCQTRLVRNPLRLLDCKHKDCVELKIEAPQIVDWLCNDCRDHFMKVLEYLDELQIPYNLDSYLVRGLDYYTRTVFEFFPKETKEGEKANSLAGGGRYDNMIEIIGGRPTPACGFGLGIERIILLLKDRDAQDDTDVDVKQASMSDKQLDVHGGSRGWQQFQQEEKPQIFLAQLGDQARRRSLVLFEDFRKHGIPVIESFSKDGLKPQLELANKLGVKYVLILGQKEVIDGTIIIRDMDGGVQEIVNLDKVVREVQKKLDI